MSDIFKIIVVMLLLYIIFTGLNSTQTLDENEKMCIDYGADAEKEYYWRSSINSWDDCRSYATEYCINQGHMTYTSLEYKGKGCCLFWCVSL